METTISLIPDGIKENIFQYRFVELLRNNGKPFSGRPTVWERIDQAVHGDETFREKLESFVVDEISNGKNRQIFLCNFSIESLGILSNYRSLQSNLAAKGLPHENINRLLEHDIQDGELVFLNVETESDNPNKVTKISLSFYKEILVEDIDSQGNHQEKSNTNYIWIDIYPGKRYLQIKVKPYSNYYIVNMEKSLKIFDYYYEYLKSTFEIVFEEMLETKNTLYNIFTVLTEKAEAPYRKEIDSRGKEIEEMVSNLAELVGLKNYHKPVDLTNRVSRLVERSLILNDLLNYKGYDKGKIGIVERIDFSDQSGARVNALSGDDGIEVADIYFDTRETIEELKSLNKIWVKWFIPIASETGEEIQQYSTRIEVFNKRVILHFLTDQSVPKEVQEHVLSLFRKFEEGEISPTIN